MKSTDAPGKQPVPFGSNGPREPITATTPVGTNQASYDQGFPPITMTLKSAGGLPPKGQDMNQILFEQSSFNRYFAAGGGYVYDSAFSTAVGGYPLSARIPNSTGTGFWLNTVEDNQANPENSTSALTGWIPMGSYGVTALTGLTSSSITLTTLQASKDRITLSGSLTANINIVVPAWIKRWEVVNNCTGAFSVTIKTPSGSGVSVPNSSNKTLWGDGTNVVFNLPSGTLIGPPILITNTSTYTPSPGTKSIVVEVQAPGGGGGGVGTTNSTSVAVASGGSAGAYAKSYLTNLLPSYSIVIGAAGVAGVSGVNGGIGGNAGNATFGGTIVCGGGFGGGSGNGSPPILQNSIGIATASGGNLLNMSGAGPTVAMAISTSTCLSGGGGSTLLGNGGGVHGSAGPGLAATGYGSGGGGANAYTNNSTQYAGAAGASGVIIVWEYS